MTCECANPWKEHPEGFVWFDNGPPWKHLIGVWK